MLFFIFILLLINAFSTIIEGSNRPTSVKAHRKKPFAALVFTNTNNISPSDKKPCQWLSRLKHQKKICEKRRGLSDILSKARELSISECENQFRFEQWNCSRREFLFKKMYRETAFMYSIASSAMMYSVARACSDSSLSGCTCGKHPKNPPNPSDWHPIGEHNKNRLNQSVWKWSGCGDNVKFARRFTKKFLQLKKKEEGFNAIVKYNTEVGITTVLKNYKNECKCHGVSGSCSIMTCVKKIATFEVISKQLRNLYHNAIKVQPGNTIGSFKDDRHARGLLYLEDSPNFCENTVHRHCESEANCATLCCTRGFDEVTVRVVNNTCLCRWRKEQYLNLQCDECLEKKIIFVCR